MSPTICILGCVRLSLHARIAVVRAECAIVTLRLTAFVIQAEVESFAGSVSPMNRD